MDLRQKWHGQPLYVWLGGVVVATSGVILWRRHRQRLASASAGSTTSTVGLSPDMQAPLPGWQGLANALGPLGGSSPSGPLSGFTTSGEPVYGLIQSQPQPQPSASLPAPTIQAAPAGSVATPTNQFHVGQTVGNIGETIVKSVYSPVYGWLNLTSLGGVYQGGGGTSGIGNLEFGGSYLGYLSDIYNKSGAGARTTEQQLHGDFSGGDIRLWDGQQGFTLVNKAGETYNLHPVAA